MTDQTERLRAAVADRYDIEREAGTGGMATVALSGVCPKSKSPQTCSTRERRDSLFVDAFVRTRGDGRSWDVFPNGKEFLVLGELQGATVGVFVVLNWTQLMGLQHSTAPVGR